jgi:cell shape-determining protein MreC
VLCFVKVVFKIRQFYSSKTFFYYRESEAFEAFCPSRLDELLREAHQLETHLKKQKEQLKNRLTDLSKTLKLQMK